MVKTTPLVNADEETDGLSSNRQDGWVVADEDDPTRRGDSSLDDANNVWDRETAEERPHGEVLVASRGGRELVAEGVVLHVNADEIVETRSGEAEDAGDFFSVEQIGGLVPMNPHAPEIVAQQVVKGISREEAETVGDPVGLIGVVVEILLRLLAELSDGLCTLVVRAGPDTKRNAVEGV